MQLRRGAVHRTSIGRSQPRLLLPVQRVAPHHSVAASCQPNNGVQPVTDAVTVGAAEAQPVYPGQPAPSIAPEGSSAVYAYPPPPPGYAYQGQYQRPGQEYYMAAPPGYYAPPPPAYSKAPEASGGAPWWIWVGVGVVAAQVLSKVQEFMRNPKTPQQMMTEMAMKQMMSSMGGPGAAGGASPFGKPGAGPTGFPPGFPAGFPTPPPGSFAQAAAAAAAAASPSVTVDVPAGSATDKKGDLFQSRLETQAAPPTNSSSAPPSTSSSQAPGHGAAASASAPAMDVVEPIVKEPSSSRSSRSASSFFADASSSQAAGNGSSSTGPAAGSPGASTSASSGDPTVMTDMMEQMLRNPEMQKMLYPYLPEPMRNPSSIEWMLNNPEVKKQMTQMFEQQNMMSPEMMGMMKNMDFSQDKVNKQFQELGLKPEDVITKVMANPELASGFQNPKVQAAIIDISANPMNIVKYQQDPEVMKVLEQVTTLFQPDIAPGKRV